MNLLGKSLKKLDNSFSNLTNKDIKILVAEDEPVTRKLLCRHLLNHGYQVLEASNGKEAWEIFQREKGNIHLALLDWVMPEIDGLEICKRMKTQKGGYYVHVIFLSVKQEKQDIITALETCADDYLTKPFHIEELLARIKVGMRIVALERALKEANQKLEKLATTDGLTGILNRRTLLIRLREELLRASREKRNVHVIMLDIDNFKTINDTYGHLSGDKVLVEFVKRLKAQLRPYDLIGRYGGEEFLIVISEVNDDTSADIAERIRLCMAKTPFKFGDLELNVTISLGVTSVRPNDRDDIDILLENVLKQADEALYEAKNKGRNCVVYKTLNT